MRKFSKFFVSLFLIFGTAVFSSCINDAYSAQDFEVSITGEQLAAMMESSRTIIDLDDSQIDFKLIITLVVNNRNFDQRIFRSNLDDARKTGFDVSFNRVPVGSKAKVKVELITFQGEKVYAESNTIKVTKKPKELTLKIGPFTVNPVISSNIVLKGTTNGYYQFSDIDNAKIISGTSTAAVSEVTDSYTFDNEGNIYYIKTTRQGSVGSYTYYWTLYSKDNSYFSTGKDITPYTPGNGNRSYQDSTPQICIDRSDNSLYVIDRYTPKIIRYPDLSALTGSYTTKNHQELILQGSGCYKSNNLKLSFTVNKGFIYILEPLTDYVYSLVKAKVESTSDDTVFNLKKIDQYTLNFKNYFGISNNPAETINDIPIEEPSVTISDIIYMDGYIYMTSYQMNAIKSNKPETVVEYTDSRTKGGYFRGALVRVDEDFTGAEICGFNSNAFSLADKYLYATKNESGELLYDSNTSPKQKVMFSANSFGNSEHTFHAALNDISDVFVAPRKIVAIKPKKLVILDSGIAFYTDDDNLLSFKTVNRLIEVDLLNFVIGNTNDDIGGAYIPENISKITIKKKDYSAEYCGDSVIENYSTLPYEDYASSLGITSSLYSATGSLYKYGIYHTVLPKE